MSCKGTRLHKTRPSTWPLGHSPARQKRAEICSKTLAQPYNASTMRTQSSPGGSPEECEAWPYSGDTLQRFIQRVSDLGNNRVVAACLNLPQRKACIINVYMPSGNAAKKIQEYLDIRTMLTRYHSTHFTWLTTSTYNYALRRYPNHAGP